MQIHTVCGSGKSIEAAIQDAEDDLQAFREENGLIEIVSLTAQTIVHPDTVWNYHLITIVYI